MTEKKQTKMELLIQFIKFGIVGVTNTVVSYVINVATLFLLGHAHIFQRWDYIIANTVAFILSVLWSFTGTTSWYLTWREPPGRSFCRH